MRLLVDREVRRDGPRDWPTIFGVSGGANAPPFFFRPGGPVWLWFGSP